MCRRQGHTCLCYDSRWQGRPWLQLFNEKKQRCKLGDFSCIDIVCELREVVNAVQFLSILIVIKHHLPREDKHVQIGAITVSWSVS